jgi:tryptophan-rich sensory protein
VLLYASLSGLWTSADPGWYAALARPPWQPPPWMFGVIWPLKFLALALGAAAVLTWLLVVLAGRFLPWTSLVLFPYALWMTVATTLSLRYWRMAR